MKKNIQLTAALAALAMMHSNRNDNPFGDVKLKRCHTYDDTPEIETPLRIDDDFYKMNVNDISVERKVAPMPSNFQEWCIDGVTVWAATKKAAIKKAKK